ncbi:MAG: radical SAM protein [Acidobacteria bacterium 13_2_20CM_2_66_4]|nr:MAG: radical SAM protein [Acidobacteria bacterium 13_2_20CM_2_66_4]
MQALLISTYEMGRQPFGLASPAAWLRAGGWDVVCVDVSKERLRDADVKSADVIAFHLPMHTATRLAAPVIAKARALNRSARICAYGLYAPLNGQWLRSIGVDAVFGGEFEEALTQWAGATRQGAVGRPFQGRQGGPERPAPQIPRIRFLVPDRSTLPPLSKYATLQLPDGTTRAVGYTEASRGCKHLCRHCPVVPIYNGQFRIVPPGVVLADAAAQVAGGAGHITFGDPDFFNGPTHAMRIVEGLHAAHPSVSYDVTIKVEHLLRHRALLPRLAETGCAFVTSAIESLDDRVLTIFDKGHTRADFFDAVDVCAAAGVTLIPTFVAFHPWLTPESYCDLLDTIAGLDLVDHVAPIQLAIRLLLPEGSRLLTTPEMRPHVGAFDPKTLTYRWTHPDRAVDALHQEVSTIVGMRLTADRRAVFEEVSRLAHDRAGMPSPSARPFRDRATVPYLNEPWYC